MRRHVFLVAILGGAGSGLASLMNGCASDDEARPAPASDAALDAAPALADSAIPTDAGSEETSTPGPVTDYHNLEDGQNWTFFDIASPDNFGPDAGRVFQGAV